MGIQDELGIASEVRALVDDAWVQWGRRTLGLGADASRIVADLCRSHPADGSVPLELPPGSCLRKSRARRWQVMSFDPGLSQALNIQMPTQAQLDAWWQAGQLTCPHGLEHYAPRHSICTESAEVEEKQVIDVVFADEIEEYAFMSGAAYTAAQHIIRDGARAVIVIPTESGYRTDVGPHWFACQPHHGQHRPTKWWFPATDIVSIRP